MKHILILFLSVVACGFASYGQSVLGIDFGKPHVVVLDDDRAMLKVIKYD